MSVQLPELVVYYLQTAQSAFDVDIEKNKGNIVILHKINTIVCRGKAFILKI